MWHMGSSTSVGHLGSLVEHVGSSPLTRDHSWSHAWGVRSLSRWTTSYASLPLFSSPHLLPFPGLLHLPSSLSRSTPPSLPISYTVTIYQLQIHLVQTRSYFFLRSVPHIISLSLHANLCPWNKLLQCQVLSLQSCNGNVFL